MGNDPEVDVGLEKEFLNGRIKFEVDYFKKNTTDLLLNVAIPGYAGVEHRQEMSERLKIRDLNFLLAVLRWQLVISPGKPI